MKNSQREMKKRKRKRYCYDKVMSLLLSHQLLMQEKEAAPEPLFETLENPARVTPSQRKVVALEDGQRYVPVKKVFVRLPCVALWVFRGLSLFI